MLALERALAGCCRIVSPCLDWNYWKTARFGTGAIGLVLDSFNPGGFIDSHQDGLHQLRGLYVRRPIS